MRHEEWHVTVTGDPLVWPRMCAAFGAKPLWIELSTFERQLMCACPRRPPLITHRFPEGEETIISCGAFGRFPVVRIKHEVAVALPDEAVQYYECHVKLNGPFNPKAPLASRDLYRENRWYSTMRSTLEFDPIEWVEFLMKHPRLIAQSTIAGWEYEACILDTHQSLDEHWVRENQTV